MSNDKHTPTPWGHSSDRTAKGITIWTNCKDGSYRYMGYVNDEKDAARIVQSVNEYDELTETIASLRAENDKLESVQTDLVFENQVYRGQIEELRAEKSELIEALRATLPILNHVVHPRIDWVRGTVRQTLAKYETK